jgi:hypothetical protein
MKVEKLKDVLEELDLIPNLLVDDDLAQKNKLAIIELLPERDGARELVEKTFCFMVYDYANTAWGTVNQPTSGVFQFRFMHDDADKLFEISQRHLDRLQAVEHGAIETAPDGHVQIFERSGANATLTARYVARRKPADLLKEKKQAIWSAGITLTLGVLSAFYSHPDAVEGLKPLRDIDKIYWEGIAGRTSTAFVVGAIMAIYDIAFYLRTEGNSPSLFFKKRE